MNMEAPTLEQRLFLSNLSIEHNFSVQTHHNAISILMDPNLPQNSNHDSDVIVAALFISHKLHDTYYLGIENICPIGVNPETVLFMEMMILHELKYKVCRELLIDQVLEWANLWDKFVQKLTCVDVSFFKENSAFTRSMLLQLVEKMMYDEQIRDFQLKKLAIAIVYLSLKEAIKQKDKKKTFNRIKFTKFIFDDFLKDITKKQLSFEEIEQQVKVVKSKNFALRDITNQHKNTTLSRKKIKF